MAIRVSDRRRLAALADPRLREERHAVEERVALRKRLSFFGRVAILLAVEEVDPESTCIADRYREAKAALAAIPDTPELEKADAAYLARSDGRWNEDWQPRPRYQPPPCVAEPIKSAIERLMMRYCTDLRDSDLTKMSAFELYAWCLSRHGETYEEAAAECEKAAKDLLLRLNNLPNDPTQEDIAPVLSAEENQ
jgi:hypothetical protein